MQIIYPYNEILPTRRAHDLYITKSCEALSAFGFAVTLISGKAKQTDLFEHYQITKRFHHLNLPLIRKNNPFNLSWNLPFFWQCQKQIKHQKPDWVFLSVRKQGSYHLQQKIAGVKYLYEVHELAYYPNMPYSSKQLFQEQTMLGKADVITVTTEALKHILQKPPYALTLPIHVVPLAVDALPLPKLAPQRGSLQLVYVGQLYKGQGLEMLLEALSKVSDVHLEVIGGSSQHIHNLSQLADQLSLQNRVRFSGFCIPSQLHQKVKSAHAFVAPFENKGRMPYVAHTKLFEYASWGRPIIAPKLPVVSEHFSNGGILYYEPDNATSLAHSLESIKVEATYSKLQQEITTYAHQFSWQNRAHTYTNIVRTT